MSNFPQNFNGTSIAKNEAQTDKHCLKAETLCNLFTNWDCMLFLNLSAKRMEIVEETDSDTSFCYKATERRWIHRTSSEVNALAD